MIIVGAIFIDIRILRHTRNSNEVAAWDLPMGEPRRHTRRIHCTDMYFPGKSQTPRRRRRPPVGIEGASTLGNRMAGQFR